MVINPRLLRNESNEESGTPNLFNQSRSVSLSLSSGAFKYTSDLVMVNCDTHLNPFSTSLSHHLFSSPCFFFFFFSLFAKLRAALEGQI